jgi:hypothetical protein
VRQSEEVVAGVKAWEMLHRLDLVGVAGFRDVSVPHQRQVSARRRKRRSEHFPSSGESLKVGPPGRETLQSTGYVAIAMRG